MYVGNAGVCLKRMIKTNTIARGPVNAGQDYLKLVKIQFAETLFQLSENIGSVRQNVGRGALS